jgi:hypothetical protein
MKHFPKLKYNSYMGKRKLTEIYHLLSPSWDFIRETLTLTKANLVVNSAGIYH